MPNLWDRVKQAFSPASEKQGNSARFEIARPMSKPTDQLNNGPAFGVYDGWISPNQYFNTMIFDMYKFMRDNIPDISAGIWSWTTLCSTNQAIEYTGGTPEQIKQAQIITKELAQRIYPAEHVKNIGMDGVLEQFFKSTFTYGAFTCELVLSRRKGEILKLNFINPATIRFKRVKGTYKLLPYQTCPDIDKPSVYGKSLGQDLIALNPNTFYYYGLSADLDNPYGTSLISPIPFVAHIQQRMMNDMEKTMHNAGYPRYHVKFTPPKQNIGESVTNYKTRLSEQFTTVDTAFKTMPPDANFISYDNVQIIVLDAAGKISIEWYNNHRAVTEQIISGMKLAPFMIGKNYGTADQWATSQYDLILRNAKMVQRAAKRMLEWIYNLELMLKGSPVRCEVHFESNRSAGEQLQNQADDMKFTTIIKKRDEGIISQDTAARELGYQRPFLDGPNEDIMWIKSQAYTKKVKMTYDTLDEPNKKPETGFPDNNTEKKQKEEDKNKNKENE